MGKVDRHLAIELLSALADGELDLSAMRDARSHLDGCAGCSAQLAEFRRLDDTLLTPAGLSCAGARELRSAMLDGELSAEEVAISVQHLDTCASCRAEQAAWVSVDADLRALPTAMPSAATDARVARLVAPAPQPRFPFGGPTVLRPLALRGAVAAAVVIAILVGLIPSAGPELATPAPEQGSVVVAGVQQVVLYSATNTFYVLQTAASAVDAVDASSYALRARINVGGRPTALALTATSVLVLDPSLRSLVEIDPQSNTVVSTTQISVAGTPTSMLVDPNSGRIIVTAIADPAPGAAPTPIVTTTENTGVVAVLNPDTKKVETVSTVDVAPKVVVTDASGKQTLLVSPTSTTVVGPSFKKIKTLPGGVSAAFAAKSDLIVVLSRDPLGAVLYFNGDGAPGPLRLVGVPLAVTSVPDVGFAVLLGATSGSGNGRIVVVDEAGRAVGSTEVGSVGRDLAYDAATKKFTVVGNGVIASAPLPVGLVAEASPKPSTTSTPNPSPDRERPTPAPAISTSPSPSAAPSASPSASPTSTPVASPSAPVAAAPLLPPGIPRSATIVGLDLYHVTASGRIPVLVAATSQKVWFVDSTGSLNALDVATGTVFPIASFPKDAEITSIAVGPSAVYAADGKNGRLYSLDLKTEQLSHRGVPFIGAHTLMAVAPDERIWFASDDQSQLISYDPRGGRLELVDTGMNGITALALDRSSRLWFTDGDRSLGSYDLRTANLERGTLISKGAARVLLPDPSGSVWVGTTAGEVISVTDWVQRTALLTGRPISSLALDDRGVAWYLTPSSVERGGFVFGRIDRADGPMTVPGAATSLGFTAGGQAWLADPAGGFYVSARPAQ